MEARLPLSSCHLGGSVQTVVLVYNSLTREVLGLEVEGERPGKLRLSVTRDREQLLPAEQRLYTAKKAHGRRVWPKGLSVVLQEEDLGFPLGIAIGAAWEALDGH